MADTELSPLLRDLLYAQQHRLLDDDVGRAASFIATAGVADAFVASSVGDRVRRHQIDQAFRGPFELPHLREGEIIQGLDERGHPVRIPLQWLNAHSLTLAGSGAGKTLMAFFHVLQLALYVSLWLFDCRKREYARIAPLLARAGIDLIVLPIRATRFNPLQVPAGVEIAEWAARISELLVWILELPPRASKMLQSLLHRLYDRMPIHQGEAHYPTLFDLQDAARRDREANQPARQAFIDSLDPLLVSLGPEVLAYRRGWQAHDLAALPINFVLGGVPSTAQDLILNALLLSEFTSRIARGFSNVRMDLYVSVDEGQRILSTRGGQTNALADLWPLVRGTGIGLGLSVPTSHGLMPEAMSFTATKYLGRFGSGADAELMARAMGLSRAQVDHAFHTLRPGRFIAQVGEGSWRRPYLLDIPLMRLADVRQSEPTDHHALRALPIIPSAGTGGAV